MFLQDTPYRPSSPRALESGLFDTFHQCVNNQTWVRGKCLLGPAVAPLNSGSVLLQRAPLKGLLGSL